MPYFEGTISKIIYKKKDFYIVNMILEGRNHPVSVVGNLKSEDLDVGSWFGLEGEWTKHQKFGNQIKVTRAPIYPSIENWSDEHILNSLESAGVSPFVTNSISKSIAKPLTDVFSTKEIFMQHASFLPGDIQSFVWDKWDKIYVNQYVLKYLYDTDVRASAIQGAWAHFGDDIINVIKECPWKLSVCSGFDMESADLIADKVGIKDRSERPKYQILEVLKKFSKSGHLYATTGQLYKFFPDLEKSEFADLLKKGAEEDLFKLEKSTKPVRVYDNWNYQTEIVTAEMIKVKVDLHKENFNEMDFKNRLASVGKKARKAVENGLSLKDCIYTAISEVSKFDLSDKQKEGVYHALVNPVSVLTGLPGTGKSTSLKVTYTILRDMGYKCLLISPTGIAAKRISQITGGQAFTIHKAFEGTPSSKKNEDSVSYAGFTSRLSNSVTHTAYDQKEVWKLNWDQPHPADFIICDESSMVDQNLVYRIVSSAKPNAQILFVGDPAQLPSVGPGSVLDDLISSGCFPVTFLDEIFRQKNANTIIDFSHKIFHGKTPTLNSKNVTFVEESDEQKCLEYIKDLAKKLFDKRENFQVISPRHLGTVGVTHLNKKLRDAINPNAFRQIRIGKDSVKIGDRVVIKKNDYEISVYNGDFGKVEKIDDEHEIVKVKIFDDPPRIVDIEKEKVATYLRMAYAVTIHSSQGLEFDNIILPVLNILVISFSAIWCIQQ